jgi:hypothetical protein
MPDDYKDNPLNIFLDVKKEDLTTRSARQRMQIISEDE